LSRAARENYFGHPSTGGSTVAELAAKSVERHRVASRKVGEAVLDGFALPQHLRPDAPVGGLP
jgi:hypothetical protein